MSIYFSHFPHSAQECPFHASAMLHAFPSLTSAAVANGSLVQCRGNFVPTTFTSSHAATQVELLPLQPSQGAKGTAFRSFLAEHGMLLQTRSQNSNELKSSNDFKLLSLLDIPGNVFSPPKLNQSSSVLRACESGMEVSWHAQTKICVVLCGTSTKYHRP